MHIVIHTQYYPPEVGAPQTRLHELALRLVQHEIPVTVLTAMPSYPLGRIYEGYGGWFLREEYEGIEVLRCLIYPYQKADLFHRLFSYLSFVFSSLWIGIWKIRKADFVITESPPLFLGIAGLLLSRLKRGSWIFNISDLWPQSAVELGVISQEGWGNKLGSVLEKFLYKQAWLVTCQSRGILSNIQERFPDVHIYHLPNGVDTDFFEPDKGCKPGSIFKVMYAGLHGLAQGLDQVLLAAKEISQTEPVHFSFLGDGPERERLIHMGKEYGLKNITFSPSIPRNKVPEHLQKADAILVSLKIQLTGAVPSKLYEAMAIGKPVILIADGEAAEIVRKAQCGIVVPPGDIMGLVGAIHYLKNHTVESEQMGRNGRAAAVRNHDRKSIADRFVNYLMAEQAVHYE